MEGGEGVMGTMRGDATPSCPPHPPLPLFSVMCNGKGDQPPQCPSHAGPCLSVKEMLLKTVWAMAGNSYEWIGGTGCKALGVQGLVWG